MQLCTARFGLVLSCFFLFLFGLELPFYSTFHMNDLYCGNFIIHKKICFGDWSKMSALTFLLGLATRTVKGNIFHWIYSVCTCGNSSFRSSFGNFILPATLLHAKNVVLYNGQFLKCFFVPNVCVYISN